MKAPPAAVLVATDEYRDESDDLAEFIQAKCIVGDVDYVQEFHRANLRSAYASWSKSVSDAKCPLEAITHCTRRSAVGKGFRSRCGRWTDSRFVVSKVSA